ncbi:Asp-tRNA(Asn)/Glu-tRNA(Gln) amidotransferase subunit GatC [Candidatus Peregrinibacteria bacterium]|nr:Asp-tRNA(Asn)/Glu-tRNA(Gln) amidotransferase subunit GatC [Candidatus Peregrinibacteria bacterium]
MPITRDQILHIAKLSRLEMTPEEIERYTEQLGSILEYMDILHEVDTSKVEPTFQVTGLMNVFSDDTVSRKSPREELLACSPLPKEKQQIKVKAVFE